MGGQGFQNQGMNPHQMQHNAHQVLDVLTHHNPNQGAPLGGDLGLQPQNPTRLQNPPVFPGQGPHVPNPEMHGMPHGGMHGGKGQKGDQFNMDPNNFHNKGGPQNFQKGGNGGFDKGFDKGHGGFDKGFSDKGFKGHGAFNKGFGKHQMNTFKGGKGDFGNYGHGNHGHKGDFGGHNKGGFHKDFNQKGFNKGGFNKGGF